MCSCLNGSKSEYLGMSTLECLESFLFFRYHNLMSFLFCVSYCVWCLQAGVATVRGVERGGGDA